MLQNTNAMTVTEIKGSLSIQYFKQYEERAMKYAFQHCTLMLLP